MKKDVKEKLEKLLSACIDNSYTDPGAVQDVKALADASIADFTAEKRAEKEALANEYQFEIDNKKIEVEKGKLEKESDRLDIERKKLEKESDRLDIERKKLEGEKEKLRVEELKIAVDKEKDERFAKIEEEKIALEWAKLKQENEHKKLDDKAEFRKFVLSCVVEPAKIILVGTFVPFAAMHTEEIGGFIHKHALNLVPKIFNK